MSNNISKGTSVPKIRNLQQVINELAPMTAGPEQLRPCFIGPTGSAKTFFCNALGKALGYKNVEVLLLGHMMPEELGGLPKVEKESYKFVPPEWALRAAREPTVIIMDELDKARVDTLGTSLTMMWESRIGELHFHPGTIIIGAMQPVDPSFLGTQTGEAISARMIFLPLNYDWDWVSDDLGIDLREWPSPATPVAPILPIPSARQTHMAAKMLLKVRGNDILSEVIAYGTQPPKLAANLISKINEQKADLTPLDMVDAILEGEVTPNDLEIGELVMIAGPLAMHGTIPLYSEAVKKVWIEGTEEDAAQFLADQDAYLTDNVLPCGGRPFLGGADGETEEDVATMIDDVAREIGEAWITAANTKEDKK